MGRLRRGRDLRRDRRLLSQHAADHVAASIRPTTGRNGATSPGRGSAFTWRPNTRRADRGRRGPVPRRDVHPARAGGLPVLQLLGARWSRSERSARPCSSCRWRSPARSARASCRTNPYQRWQLLDGTIHANARWIYERIHFDPTPIDVVLLGPSRMGAGVNAPRLAKALDARGLPANVVNFSLPEAGRNMNWAVARGNVRRQEAEAPHSRRHGKALALRATRLSSISPIPAQSRIQDISATLTTSRTSFISRSASCVCSPPTSCPAASAS